MMKKLFYSLLVLLVGTVCAQAQDVITKHDGTDIQAKILEVNTDQIKYKRFNNPDGPTFTINKSEVLMVRYSDGTKDLFNNTQPAPQQPQRPSPRQNSRQQQDYAPQGGYAAEPQQRPAPSSLFGNEIRNMFRKDPNASIGWGLRFGMELSNFRGGWAKELKEGNDHSSLNARVGFDLGAVVDIPITHGFYIQPGLSLTTRGARYIYKEVDDGDKLVAKNLFRPLYLQIPVLASFRANVTDKLQVQLNTGPYFAFGLGGRVVTKTLINGKEWKPEDEDYEDYEDFFDLRKKFFGNYGYYNGNYHFGAKRFDFGWIFGAGLKINNMFFVGLQYDLGAVNMLREEEWGVSMYNGSFSIRMGFDF